MVRLHRYACLAWLWIGALLAAWVGVRGLVRGEWAIGFVFIGAALFASGMALDYPAITGAVAKGDGLPGPVTLEPRPVEYKGAPPPFLGQEAQGLKGKRPLPRWVEPTGRLEMTIFLTIAGGAAIGWIVFLSCLAYRTCQGW